MFEWLYVRRNVSEGVDGCEMLLLPLLLILIFPLTMIELLRGRLKKYTIRRHRKIARAKPCSASLDIQQRTGSDSYAAESCMIDSL